jgi:uncharacterized damage-inducible protein DinB
METRLHLAGFRREVLAEVELAESQLLALAAAVPAEDYGWAPAEGARTFSAVLMHIAAGNLGLLDRAGSRNAEVADLYAGIEGEGPARVAGIVRRNALLEKNMTEKAAVIDFLAGSFSAVKSSWTTASEEELWATVHIFGELETARRLYLRMLAHSHEHMGQAIAYVRAMGYQVAWPDPLKKLEEMEAVPR